MFHNYNKKVNIFLKFSQTIVTKRFQRSKNSKMAEKITSLKLSDFLNHFTM